MKRGKLTMIDPQSFDLSQLPWLPFKLICTNKGVKELPRIPAVYFCLLNNGLPLLTMIKIKRFQLHIDGNPHRKIFKLTGLKSPTRQLINQFANYCYKKSKADINIGYRINQQIPFYIVDGQVYELVEIEPEIVN